VNDKSDLNIVDGNGLPPDGESYHRMIFVSEKEGYLFGEKHGDAIWANSGEAFRTDTAKVYNTIDGGNTWKGQKLGAGTIINAHRTGSDIYTIRYNNANQKDTSIIYKLNKQANRWEIMTTINSYVRDVDFSLQNDWIITQKENNGYFKLYQSKNKGATWDAVLNNFVFQPVISDTTISFLDLDRDTNTYNMLIVYNRTNGSIKKTTLPSSLHATLLRKSGKTLYITGVESDSLSIYKFEEAGKNPLIYKTYLGDRTFPKELIVYDHQLILLAGVRRGMYIENYLMKSIDDGKNWVEEQLYKPTYASPMATYPYNEKELKTWIYSGSGKIQIFK
jgi:hypothetical protein